MEIPPFKKKVLKNITSKGEYPFIKQNLSPAENESNSNMKVEGINFYATGEKKKVIFKYFHKFSLNVTCIFKYL